MKFVIVLLPFCKLFLERTAKTALSRSPSGASLGQHHDLSARFALLHAAMRLSDLVKVEGFTNQDVQRARRDLFDQILAHLRNRSCTSGRPAGGPRFGWPTF